MSNTADIPGQLAIEGAPINAPAAEPAPKRTRKPRTQPPTTEQPTMQPNTPPGEPPTSAPASANAPPAAPPTFFDPVARLMNICANNGADITVTVLSGAGAKINGMEPIPGDQFDPDALDLPPGTYKMRVRRSDGTVQGTYSYAVAGDPRAFDHPGRAAARVIERPQPGTGLEGVIADLAREVREMKNAPAPRLDWINNLPSIITAAQGIFNLLRPTDPLSLKDLLPLLRPEKSNVTEMIEALATLDTLRGEAPAASTGGGDGEMVKMLMPLIAAGLQQPANPRANDPNYQRAPARDPAIQLPRAHGAPAMTASARPPDSAPASPTMQPSPGARRMQPLPEPRADDAIGALAVTLAEAARRNQPPQPAAAYALRLFDGGDIMQAMSARGADFPAVESFTDPNAAATCIIDALSAAEPELLTPIRPFMLAVRDEVIDLMRDDEPGDEQTETTPQQEGAQQA